MKTRWRAQSLLYYCAAACILAIVTGAAQAAEATNPSSDAAAILQDIRRFGELGSVLYVAAHPDDENTQLITYLARGRLLRTAYLSLTRGDGGQNLLGPEFGDELGVIRTQELLAARRLDGGRQFFTRARDFGYSKDYLQTLNKWDHQQVLSDIVRVIRTFRPDVLITRFSTVPGATHGHHTASAVLAVEAFKISGDPNKFPEQLTAGLTAWQPKRIFLNGFGAGFRRPDQLVPGASGAVNAVRIDINGMDPALGISFSQIAARSRAMHKTQGFGNYGGNGRSGPQYEAFQLLGGEPAKGDILAGVNTTWARFPGGTEIADLSAKAAAQFDPQNPPASLPALLEIKRRLAALPADLVIDEKRRDLDTLIQHCLGLSVATTVADAQVVPGEAIKLTHHVSLQANYPVRWTALRFTETHTEIAQALDLQPGQSVTRQESVTIPASTPLTQPYWLRKEPTPGMFRVDDPSLIGRPESPPAFSVQWILEIGGQSLVISDEPVQVIKDDVRRRLDVIPPVTLRYTSDVELFPPGARKTATVEVAAYRANVDGTVGLDAGDGWTVSPLSRRFHLGAVGDSGRFTFAITAPAQTGTAGIIAHADIGGARFSNQRIVIAYPHIPRQLLQPPARLKALSIDLAIRGTQVGYLPGAGDSVAESLSQMGYAVTPLTGSDLTPQKLSQLDAVVIGVRAFNTRTDLAPHLAALFDYVKSGGTVVAQYNTPNGLTTPRLAPFDLQLSRDLPHNRVTDENAPITLLAPNHPVLNTPNHITAADFDGWVQERGLNFPSQWDADHFAAILACSDLGQTPLKSGLLVAHDGKGYYVYTGLSFFRQLPAGVPGAFRLFANMVSLGK